MIMSRRSRPPRSAIHDALTGTEVAKTEGAHDTSMFVLQDGAWPEGRRALGCHSVHYLLQSLNQRVKAKSPNFFDCATWCKLNLRRRISARCSRATPTHTTEKEMYLLPLPLFIGPLQTRTPCIKTLQGLLGTEIKLHWHVVCGA